jgi:thiamine-phosphate pyrophosphorylase
LLTTDERRLPLLLYYITDRSQFPGDENSRRARLLETVAQAVRCGVDFVQLREKDLSPHQLERLAREAVRLRTENQKLKTAFLINSRSDIAIACGAQGVHLRSDDISPSEVKKIWTQSSAGAPARVTVGGSCHTRAEIAKAAKQGADFVVFGPVFEKISKEKAHTRPAGVEALRDACQEKIPVIALGGVTLENAQTCIEAGAAGIAAIRLFQENKMGEIVAALRRLEAVVGRQSSADPETEG